MKAQTQSSDFEIIPSKHQKAIVTAPHFYPDYDWFILAGGYGCGKSYSIVLCVLDIVETYNGYDISVGIGSVTITLAQKTIFKDLQSILVRTHSEYTYNSKDNILTIGTIKFFFIATEQPSNIYAYNLNIFLCDEIDELSQTKVLDANKAIRERTRVMLPDGRIPYIMYFSTVQGYRGLYHVVKTLKTAGEKYILVRGETKDNPYIAKSQVESLYRIYDDMERMAFLEGRFVNLRSGRVYTEYDEDKHRVAPFDITKEYVVMIGQDLNSGFSKAAAVIKKDKKLYITCGWSFQEIGLAPGIMRQKYIQNEILWFPDSAGKEIIKGYKQQIIDNGIQCRIGSSNPRIIDRVFYINKLFRMGLLYVFDNKECDELSEALKVRAYDNNGKPEKGQGETAPDHYCDALEYVIYRIVRSDPDFMNLKELSRENVRENGYLNIAGTNI